MSNISGYNYRNKNTALSFFIPSLLTVLLYGVITVVLIMVLNFGDLRDFITGDGLERQSAALSSVFQGRLTEVNKVFDAPGFGRAALFLFWLSVGSVLYMIAWSIKNLVSKLHGDMQVANYIKPRAFKEVGYWNSIIAGNIFFVAAVLVFFVVLVALLLLVIPFVSESFLAGLYALPSVDTFVKWLVGFGVMALSLHVFFLVWRALRGAWRTVFYRGA